MPDMITPRAASLAITAMERRNLAAATDAAISDLDRALLLVHRITDVQVMPNTDLIQVLHLIETSRAQMQVLKTEVSNLQSSLDAARSDVQRAEQARAAAEARSSSLAVGGSSPIAQQSSGSSDKSDGVSVGATVGIAGASLLVGGLIGYTVRGGK